MVYYNYNNLLYDKDYTICYSTDYKSIKDIKFHPNTKVIAANAFEGCWNIENLVFPENLEIIEAKAFIKTNVKKINFTSNIIKIEDDAFRGCDSLENIDLSMCKKLKVLNKAVFRGCAELETVILPENLSEIKEYCFAYSGLSKINFPKNLNFIDKGAFNKCSCLTKVDLSLCDNLKFLNEDIFNDCYNLKKVMLPKNLIEIKENCFSETGLYEITFPPTLKFIRSNAFFGNNNLEKIDLKNVKEIGHLCFSNCSNLKEAVLPETLEQIGEKLFSKCYNLKKVNVGGNVLLPENSFDGTARNITLLIDASKKKEYEKIFKEKQNITLQTKSIDYYLDKNKSFKEINSAFKDDLLR